MLLLARIELLMWKIILGSEARVISSVNLFYGNINALEIKASQCKWQMISYTCRHVISLQNCGAYFYPI